MDKCDKTDCVDFDIGMYRETYLANCDNCSRNRPDPDRLRDHFLQIADIVDPTEDVPPVETDRPTRIEVQKGVVRDAVEEADTNFDRYNTGLDQKKDNFDTFGKLIANQFLHGGAKYKLKGDKEFTDAICEAFPGTSGIDWILGTCMKYLGRYKNFGREKDLLKIATYMYLLWLKGGFHLNATHDEDIKRSG